MIINLIEKWVVKPKRNWRNVIEVVTLVVSFVALAFWLEQMMRGVLGSVKSISLHYLWWVMGIAVVALLVWLFRNLARRGYAAGKAMSRIRIRPGWVIVVLLLVGYSVLVYYKYPWHELEEMSENEIKEVKKSTCLWEIPDYISDEMLKLDIRSGCPAIIKMKKNQMIVWWGDKKKFKSSWFYDEHAQRNGKVVDKFRVFQPRTGVVSVEIKIHRYYDPDPLWYTRQ